MKEELSIALKLWGLLPRKFFNDVIGFCYSHQHKIAESVLNNKRTAVKAGHGVGKSYCMAGIAWWWLVTRFLIDDTCAIKLVAPNKAQGESTFWKNFTRIYHKSPDFLKGQFVLIKNSIYHRHHKDNWYIKTVACDSKSPEGLQGEHGCLFLIEEGTGIDNWAMEIIEGVLTDAISKLLVISNPTRNVGWFYDAFHRDSKFWSGITISGEDCREGVVYDDSFVDNNGRFIERKRKGLVQEASIMKYKSKGIFNDNCRVRLFGEFPESSKDLAIPRFKFDRALDKPIHNDKRDDYFSVVGIDLATSGSDHSVMAWRVGRDLRELKRFPNPKKIEDFYEIISKEFNKIQYNEEGIDYIIIDMVGNDGMVNSLIEAQKTKRLIKGFKGRILGFRGGASVSEYGRGMYYNRRSELWIKYINDWLDVGSFGLIKRGDFAIDLEEDLCNIKREYRDSSSRNGDTIKLESKESYTKRGFKSPHYGDAFSYTFHMGVKYNSKSEVTYKRKKKEEKEEFILNNRIANFRKNNKSNSSKNWKCI